MTSSGRAGHIFTSWVTHVSTGCCLRAHLKIEPLAKRISGPICLCPIRRDRYSRETIQPWSYCRVLYSLLPMLGWLKIGAIARRGKCSFGAGLKYAINSASSGSLTPCDAEMNLLLRWQTPLLLTAPPKPLIEFYPREDIQLFEGHHQRWEHRWGTTITSWGLSSGNKVTLS